MKKLFITAMALFFMTAVSSAVLAQDAVSTPTVKHPKRNGEHKWHGKHQGGKKAAAQATPTSAR